MKIALVVICLALCLGVALGGYQAQCANESGCKARASARIVVRGRGKCSAEVSSSCRAARLSTGRCVRKDTKYRQLKCRGESDIVSDAKCFAGAAVEAYTAANVDLSCKGRNTFTCGFAQARAKSVACAVARAIVDQLVFFKKDHDPVCDVQIDALIKAVAEVATKSRAGGCIGGRSFLWDNDYDYAAAFEIVFAKAFSSCWTYCDKNAKDVFVDAEGEADVVESGTITIGDGARARTRHPRRHPRRHPHHTQG